jgi:leucyl aminopeptidase
MASFHAHSLSSGRFDADVLIVPITGPEPRIPQILMRISRSAAERAQRAIALKDFEPKSGSRFLLHPDAGDGCPRVLLAGLGDGASSAPAAIRKALSLVARDPLFERVKSVALLLDGWSTGADLEEPTAAALDGFLEGTYRWSAATEKKTSRPDKWVVVHEEARWRPRIAAAFERAEAIGNAALFARDLANAPPNRMSPEDLGKAALAMAKKHGLEASVLGPRELERERMHALLAVGQGSERGPRLIVVRYDPGTREKPVALIGKGIVFDSGGYTIKPLESMVEMKFDKSGACVVLGAMQAIAQLRPPVPVVAVVAAAENMISGTAYRTGDVIESRSGKTIEVLNTDAEGRLVLADAIHYAITEWQPQAVIDIATLTGAVYYALGDHACAVLGTDEDLIARLRASGERVGERAWPLPINDDYSADVNTGNADVRNTSAWGAGAIAGATFLQRFADGIPWAHLDVASVSRDRRTARGATGFGLRLLVDAIEHWPRPRAKRSARGRTSKARR